MVAMRRAVQLCEKSLHRDDRRVVVVLTDQRDDLGPPRRDLVLRKHRTHNDVGEDLKDGFKIVYQTRADQR